MNEYEEGFVEGLATGMAMREPKHKHCIRCEEEMLIGAKRCPLCGAVQPPEEEEERLDKMIEEYW